MTNFRRTVWAGVVAIAVATASSGRAALTPQPAAPETSAELIDRAYEAAYNLDHDDAVALARQAITTAPDDPDTHRALAGILWLNMLFRRGAVTVDHYMGGATKSFNSLPKPPPDLDAEFHRELDASIRLADARLTRSPSDLDARSDLGASYALQASYAAAIENSTVSAFRSAKKAYDNAEDVLEQRPTEAGANLLVGTYRYIIATLALPSRWVAYIAGFGGDKDKGIRMVESALADSRTHLDAAAALILIYSREGRHDDVVRLLTELIGEYPRNRLFVLEKGSAEIRADRPTEAEAVLTAGLAELDGDTRPKIPGERALWLYKRGAARVLLRHLDPAQADLSAALGSGPVDWVRGRIHLDLGKVEDLRNDRGAALVEYRQAHMIADANNDAIASAAAARYERRPYGRQTP